MKAGRAAQSVQRFTVLCAKGCARANPPCSLPHHKPHSEVCGLPCLRAVSCVGKFDEAGSEYARAEGDGIPSGEDVMKVAASERAEMKAMNCNAPYKRCRVSCRWKLAA